MYLSLFWHIASRFVQTGMIDKSELLYGEPRDVFSFLRARRNKPLQTRTMKQTKLKACRFLYSASSKRRAELDAIASRVIEFYPKKCRLVLQ